MFRNFIFSVILLTGVFIFTTPEISFAQNPQSFDSQIGEDANRGQFVPCSGTSCSACHLVQLANNVIDWLIGILATIFAILAVVSGIRLVVSGGNESAKTSAKSTLTNAFIGLLIVLGAWLLIDTLMRALVGDNGQVGSAPWGEIECWAQRVSQTIIVVGDAEFISGTSAAATGGQGVQPTGNLVTYAGVQFDEAVVDKAKYLDTNFDLRISGGYRTPERNAEVNGSATSYHLSGRAIDLVGSQNAMKAGADWAKKNGAKEVLIHNAGSGAHLHVAW